jgi:hypothetical protein
VVVVVRRGQLFSVLLLSALIVLLFGSGCEDSGQVSTRHARAHVELLAGYVARDVEQVRQGLPAGAEQLTSLWGGDEDPLGDPQLIKRRLERTRDKVFELSIAKSTFFALASPDGMFVRSDQDVDGVAGKSFFTAFPELKGSTAKYLEARGNMPELWGVKGKPDGQWVAAAPILRDGQVAGIYVTGWSWVRYCYSLEESLRSSVRSSLVDEKGNIDREPLLYVFLLAGQEVFGAPTSPQVNADRIGDLRVLDKVRGEAIFTTPLEIDGRSFGLAVKRTPALGSDTAVAVLRSET